MPPITVELTLERETKNKVRFAEHHGEEQLGTIYLPKTTWDALGRPRALTIALEPALSPQLAQAA